MKRVFTYNNHFPNQAPYTRCKAAIEVIHAVAEQQETLAGEVTFPAGKKAS